MGSKCKGFYKDFHIIIHLRNQPMIVIWKLDVGEDLM